MAKTREAPTRTYKFSDGTLVQKGEDIAQVATRDLTDLLPHGVTAAKISAMRTNAEAFGDLKTDEEWEQDVAAATETKDNKRSDVEAHIRLVRAKVSNVYGDTSIKYARFKFTDMATLTDSDYVRSAKRVHRQATADLANIIGLTAAQLTALDADITLLDNAIDNQQDIIHDRDIATQARIENGNALYKEVTDITEIGKAYYLTRDEAKYNDYVIYNTPSGGPEAPPVP